MSVANFGSECVPVGGARSEPFGASANAPRSARVNRQRPAPPRSRRPFPPLTPLSPPVPSSQRDQAHGQGAVLRPLERGEGQHLRRRRRRFRPRRPGRRSQARPRCVRAKPKRKEKPSPGRGPPIPPALGRRSGRPPRVLAHESPPRPLASISQARASPRSRPSRASTRARTPSRGRPRSTGLRIPRGSPRGARTANSTSAPPRWARAGSTRRSRGQTTRRVRRWRR